MKKERQISETCIFEAKEEYVRRLAKYVGIQDVDLKSKMQIIDDLQCSGIVKAPWLRGNY